jgi:hypothetical protein
MKDQKGYTHRPFDPQDRIILWACGIATILLLILL